MTQTKVAWLPLKQSSGKFSEYSFNPFFNEKIFSKPNTIGRDSKRLYNICQQRSVEHAFMISVDIELTQCKSVICGDESVWPTILQLRAIYHPLFRAQQVPTMVVLSRVFHLSLRGLCDFFPPPLFLPGQLFFSASQFQNSWSAIKNKDSIFSPRIYFIYFFQSGNSSIGWKRDARTFYGPSSELDFRICRICATRENTFFGY